MHIAMTALLRGLAGGAGGGRAPAVKPSTDYGALLGELASIGVPIPAEVFGGRQ